VRVIEAILKFGYPTLAQIDHLKSRYVVFVVWNIKTTTPLRDPSPNSCVNNIFHVIQHMNDSLNILKVTVNL
jgi:hypothetical protein